MVSKFVSNVKAATARVDCSVDQRHPPVAQLDVSGVSSGSAKIKGERQEASPFAGALEIVDWTIADTHQGACITSEGLCFLLATGDIKHWSLNRRKNFLREEKSDVST
jgi:hypothetical protein